ncbi:arginyltransferase [Rhodotorula paludigena]|uniref:arginyltransferase n=1 Tax=Rhodotorula paludigena TaxID=86838 RepID=UPI003176191A
MASSTSSVADSDGDSSASSQELLSILQPLGYSANSCGYCSEIKGGRSTAKSSKSYGCWAHVLSASTYKGLLDRGFRRSGAYLYKPDMAATCCPQYTITLDASAFKPSRSQRQVLQRFAAFMRDGEREGQAGWGPAPSERSGAADAEMDEASVKGAAKGREKGKGKGKAGQSAAADWGEAVHAGDWEQSNPTEPFKHRFEYIVEPASYTDEKYALFRRYQMEVHSEPASKVSAKGFRRFLVDTPLELEPTRSSAYSYGSHHALYRLDGKLIAFAVLDLLPKAVSSVYFVWDPDYAGMSLGKVSALREAQMVREMERAGAWEGEGGRYMMGFYIHSCPKMRYKADYQPSLLLDPETNAYYPWSQCKPLLDTGSRITSFATVPDPLDPSAPVAFERAASGAPQSSHDKPETSTHKEGDKDDEDREQASDEDEEDDEDDDDVDFPSPPPPGCLEPTTLSKDLLLRALALERRAIMPLLLSTAWHDPQSQAEVRELLASVGERLVGKIAVWLGR